MTRSTFGVLLSLAVFEALAPLRAYAVTRRVPSEFATINNALDLSDVGDTVLVAPGTYTDHEVRGGSFPNISCAFLTDGVVLRSESGPTVTTIDMQGFAIIGQENVIYGSQLMSGTTAVEGFTVTGTPDAATAILFANGEKVTIRNCIVRDVGTNNSDTGGVIGADNSVEVVDCVFTNCRGEAYGGIFVNDARLFVEGCTFIDNPSRPIGMTGEPGVNAFGFEMRDCTFIRNGNPTTGEGTVNINQLYDGAVVQRCYFQENYETGGGGALQIVQCRNTLVEDCVFWKNRTVNPASFGGALGIGSIDGGIVRGCTFVENRAGDLQVIGGATLYLAGGAFVLDRNVVAHSGVGGPAVRLQPGSTIANSCNVFWNNLEGDTYGFTLSPTDRVVDPLFCNSVAGDFTVSNMSPCLPPNSLGCGLIGALPQGCGVISIESKSWGAIKGAYR